MSQLTVIKYTFEPYFDGYFQEGSFYSKYGKLIKQKYYNGRPCINYNKKRYGMRSLRRFAKRTEVVSYEYPF